MAKYCDIVPELLLVYCSILDITQHIHQSPVRRKSPIFHFLSQQSHNNKEVLFIQLEMTVYEQLLCGLQVLPNKYNTLSLTSNCPFITGHSFLKLFECIVQSPVSKSKFAAMSALCINLISFVEENCVVRRFWWWSLVL